MNKIIFLVIFAGIFFSSAVIADSCDDSKMGDVNGDKIVDISDAIAFLYFLFTSAALPCQDNADVNGDGAYDLSDVIYILNYLFSNGPNPVNKCNEGPVSGSEPCSCGDKIYNSGYCCYKKHYNAPCEYAIYSERKKNIYGDYEENIFLCRSSNPEECGPVKQELWLTENSENAHPDIALIDDGAITHICPPETSYPYGENCEEVFYREFPLEHVAVFQRFESGSFIYGCPVYGKKAEDCDNKNKKLFAQGYNPSIEFAEDINSGPNIDQLPYLGIPRTADVLSVWETDSEIQGCIVYFDSFKNTLNINPLSCIPKTIAAKKTSGALDEPVLRGSNLLWKDNNPRNGLYALYACKLKSAGELLPQGTENYPLSCYTSKPIKIDEGPIGPGTGDIASSDIFGDNNLLVAYFQLAGVYNSDEYMLYINGAPISFDGILTLRDEDKKINPYQPPQMFSIRIGDKYNYESKIYVYIAFKDINYENPQKSASLTPENIIWILGGEKEDWLDITDDCNTIPDIDPTVEPTPDPPEDNPVAFNEIDKSKYSTKYLQNSLMPISETKTCERNIVSIHKLIEKGLKLYRVYTDYHASTHGPNVLCNMDTCYIIDKQLGAKSEGKLSETGKFSQWNNFQNDFLICDMKGIEGLLSKGAKKSCFSNGIEAGYIERIL